jgi:hypothetical protein
MNEEQADRMIDLLSEIKDQLSSLGDRVESVENKLDSFSGLSDLAESLTSEGLFSDSFAERVGEKFNEGICDKLDSIGEDLGSKLGTIADKLDDVNSSIGSIGS